MTNHPNRARDLPPLALSLKAYRQRHGLTMTTAADHFDVSRDWIREAESARAGKTTMAQVLAHCLDQL